MDIEKFITKDRIDNIRRVREATREHGCFAASSVIGKGAVAELKNLLSLYDEGLYILMSELYDHEIGGFYYSLSARDTEGFLPDLESTKQVLNSVFSLGLRDEELPLSEVIPVEIVGRIADFAKSLQAPDGYFYHPQWGEKISDTRKQKDEVWAINILKSFSCEPKYPIPADRWKNKDGERLEILSSVDSFKKYLSSIDLSKAPTSVANQLAVNKNQIKGAGAQYVEELKRWLTSWRWLWLWQESENYDSVNALIRICEVYDIMDIILPYQEVILEAAIRGIDRENTENVLYCDNPWKTINGLFKFLRASNARDELYCLRTRLWRRAEELIRKTRDNVLIFKRDDGGFSYTPMGSACRSQGAPVAVPNSCESDINATLLASSSTVNGVCTALGIPRIEIFCQEDGDLFFELLKSKIHK